MAVRDARLASIEHELRLALGLEIFVEFGFVVGILAYNGAFNGGEPTTTPAFAIAFTRRMFKAVNVSDEDVQWISAELARTPPWIAMAAYSDFLIADYANVLPSIKLPVAVFAADSEIYKNGIEMGKAIAAQVPCSKFFPFEDAGHLLFYEKPEKFNRALSEFVMAIR